MHMPATVKFSHHPLFLSDFRPIFFKFPGNFHYSLVFVSFPSWLLSWFCSSFLMVLFLRRSSFVSSPCFCLILSFSHPFLSFLSFFRILFPHLPVCYFFLLFCSCFLGLIIFPSVLFLFTPFFSPSLLCLSILFLLLSISLSSCFGFHPYCVSIAFSSRFLRVCLLPLSPPPTHTNTQTRIHFFVTQFSRFGSTSRLCGRSFPVRSSCYHDGCDPRGGGIDAARRSLLASCLDLCSIPPRCRRLPQLLLVSKMKALEEFREAFSTPHWEDALRVVGGGYVLQYSVLSCSILLRLRHSRVPIRLIYSSCRV